MITDWLLSLPPLLVYAGLFAVVAGESSGLPLPGETSLIAVGALAAHHGGISIGGVIAVAAVAAIVGDNIGFAIGRHGGRRLLDRDGRWSATRRAYLERGETFFAAHGPKAVFLARWLPGLRVIGAWLAGTHGMRWPTFLLWNALGGIAWAVTIGLLAYTLGHAAAGLFTMFGYAGVAVVATGAVLAFVWHRRRRRSRATAAERTRSAPG